MKTLYPNMLLNDGIMSDLLDFNVPWREDVDNVNLDLGYYQHSAQKLVSPLLFDISGAAENIKNFEPVTPLTEQQRTRVAGTVYNLFHRKWVRLYGVYTAEYNPIENYSMVESETIGKDISRATSDTGTLTNSETGTIADSGTETGTLTNAKTGTVSNQGSDTGTVTNAKTGTVTNAGTETGTIGTVTDKDTTNTGTQQNAGTSDTENGIFGFNSDTSVGSDTSNNTNSNTRTDNLASTEDITSTETRNLANSNTETYNTTDTETRNLSDGNTRTLNTQNQETRNLAASETIADDTDRQLTRSGNIGVTTSQQMLQSDVDLWQWNFFKQVFEDIDSILCLSVY